MIASSLLVSSLFVVGGVLLLYLGADWLVRGSSTLGTRAGISPLIVGLTVVSMGTSAPELVVCVLAALRGSPDIAIGNVLGSNFANVGLVLGLGALIRPLAVAGGVIRRDIPLMIGVTVVTFPLLLNLTVGLGEGAVLAVVFIVYLGVLMRSAQQSRAFREPLQEVVGELATDPGESSGGFLLPIAQIVAGSLLLVGGGTGVVRGATELAEALGVPELLVGLTVVAIGTSLPELATMILAALRNEAGLAVGNIVGSNVFNLTFVLGGTAMIAPIDLPSRILSVEYPVILALSVALLPLAILRRRLGRPEGIVLLLLYAAGWVWMGIPQG
ncbi:MAG: calcium/sodium antiporter [Gemmatimonadota bacterium]